jgi:hypothetical protein
MSRTRPTSCLPITLIGAGIATAAVGVALMVFGLTTPTLVRVGLDTVQSAPNLAPYAPAIIGLFVLSLVLLAGGIIAALTTR